jgi:hypothetical protein
MPKKKNKKENIQKDKKIIDVGGRPTIYSEKLANKICKVVSSTSYGIRKICRLNPDFPDPDTIRVWRLEKDGFSASYNKAKQAQADILAEDCLDIADDDSGDLRMTKDGDEVFNGEFAARSRLRVDTRKWLASKLIPKVYGDRLELEKKEEENHELREEIRQLRAKLDQKNKRDY